MPENSIILFTKKILSIAIGILVISIILLSLVPPVTKDALVHHLAVPKLFLEHGWMYEIPFMDFSYYPMNLDLLYMIPLYFGNDIAPKFIHFAFALLTAWLVFKYLYRRTNKGYGLLGALLFLSIPIIVKLSVTVYVDLGEIFFSFASFLLILEWLKNDFKIKYLLYSGIMCGLALGTKYNGLVTLLILTLFIPFLYSRYNRNKKYCFIKSLGHCFAFLLISLIVFSPWMIRNYHWKNNPIYPLYNKVFNTPNHVNYNQQGNDLKNNIITQNRGTFTYRSIVYKESGWEIALLPVRIFFHGKDGDPQYFDGRLNPFLFIFLFFAFLRFNKKHGCINIEKKVMLAFCILFFFFAFFTSVLRIRYISPIIPPLVILSVFGIKNLFGFMSGRSSQLFVNAGKAFIVICLVFFLSLNGHYIFNLFKTVAPVPYITGKISRDDYISRFIPEYPSLKYINENLPLDSNIYFIFLGKRGYYCDRDYLFGMGIMSRLIKRLETPEDILKEFHDLGITHLLINYRIFEKWMNNNFSEEKKALTQEFFQKHMSLLFMDNGFGVNVLKSKI